MENIKPYDKYKDSSVNWLGDIPEHWNLCKAKWLFKKENRMVRDEDEVVTAFRDGQVTLRKNRREDGFTIAIQEHGYQGIRKGDLIIHGMDAFAGAIGVSDSNGKSSPVYNVCTLREEGNVFFFSRIVREMANNGFILSLAQGIRERSTDFRFKIFGELLIPIPQISEQQTIAAFLDYKLGKIDRFILKKKKLIKLLNEQKAAIINQAVTKGLDANAKMKSSGIDWLGDIPEHWEMIKLQYLCRIRTGGKNTEDRKAEGEYNFYVRSQKIEKIDSYSFDGEGILTAGDGVGVGKVFHYVNEKFDYHQRVYLFYKFAEKVFPKHLFYFLKTYLKIDLMLYNAKSTVDSVRLPILKSFQVITPPKDEQIKIVEFIETETATINQTISTIEKEIALVQEYRTTLIAEAVTGKIDVRGYEIPTLTIDEEILDETESDTATDEEFIEEDAE